MRKVVSYRQKLIELARIYKIYKILDANLKLTTYEIELELLKNKVPIPSRRGYFSHKIINEILNPFIFYLKETLRIDLKFYKNYKNQFNKFGDNIKKDLSTYLNLNKILKIIYIKSLITDGDGLKISLEKKSDKKEIVKIPEIAKKNKSKKLAKKPEVTKEPYDPETDYKLNTQTVLNLFEDLEYDLDHVRRKKLVKPIYFTRLPKDLDSIRSNTRKKETFLQILLPLVVAENEKIKKDRKYLFEILKDNASKKNTIWINKKYKEYRVSNKNIDELIEKIDIIPTSVALAQAAKESGWGTSRFALEGNAIFGQWTWNGVGMAPLDKDEDQKHKILKFPLLRASVKAYITNLNTHPGYKKFRKKRLKLRAKNKNLSGLDLIHELDNYAQTGKEYTKVLEQIIKQNDLDEFETVTIDDFKEENELKL